MASEPWIVRMRLIRRRCKSCEMPAASARPIASPICSTRAKEVRRDRASRLADHTLTGHCRGIPRRTVPAPRAGHYAQACPSPAGGQGARVPGSTTTWMPPRPGQERGRRAARPVIRGTSRLACATAPIEQFVAGAAFQEPVAHFDEVLRVPRRPPEARKAAPPVSAPKRDAAWRRSNVRSPSTRPCTTPCSRPPLEHPRLPLHRPRIHQRRHLAPLLVLLPAPVPSPPAAATSPRRAATANPSPAHDTPRATPSLPLPRNARTPPTAAPGNASAEPVSRPISVVSRLSRR